MKTALSLLPPLLIFYPALLGISRDKVQAGYPAGTNFLLNPREAVFFKTQYGQNTRPGNQQDIKYKLLFNNPIII